MLLFLSKIEFYASFRRKRLFIFGWESVFRNNNDNHARPGIKIYSASWKNEIVIKQIIYPDHFQFTEKNYKVLSKEAENNKCDLLTTEKDYLRINNNFKEKIYYTKLNTLLIEKESLEKELKKLF